MSLALLLTLCLAGAEPAETVESYAARAFEATKAGRYAEAIKLYTRGYELTPLSSILYNLAAIYDRRLKDPTVASDYYRRYLAAPDADPELAKKASARLDQIQQERQQRSRIDTPTDDEPAKPAPTPAPPTPVSAPAPVPVVKEAPPPAGTPHAAVAIALGAAGVAAIGVGTGFGIDALSRNTQAKAFCVGKTCSDARGVALTNSAMTSANVANVLVPAGAALGVAAIIVAIVAPRSEGPRVSVAPTSGGAAVVVGGAF